VISGKTFEDALQCLAQMTVGRDYNFMSDENEEPLDPNDTTKNWRKLTKLKATAPIIRKTGTYIHSYIHTYIHTYI